jgi:hypothetical protein
MEKKWIDLEDQTPDELGIYKVGIQGLGAESIQRQALANWGGNEFTLNNEDLKDDEYVAKWKTGRIKEQFHK